MWNGNGLGGNGNGLGGYVDKVEWNRQCGMEIDRVDVHGLGMDRDQLCKTNFIHTAAFHECSLSEVVYFLSLRRTRRMDCAYSLRIWWKSSPSPDSQCWITS